MSTTDTTAVGTVSQARIPTRPLPPTPGRVWGAARHGAKQDPRKRRMPAGVLAAAALTVLLWASAFVGVRAVAGTISPGAVALGRLTVASVLLGVVIALGRGLRRPSGRDVLLISLCGIVWVAGYNVAITTAAQHMDAGTVAVLVNVGPVLIALLAGLFLGEGFPKRLFLGASVALGGVAVIASAGSTTQGLTVTNVALCLFAAVAYAAATVMQKPLLRRIPALQLTWMTCTAGALACLPFASDLLYAASQSPQTMWWVLYLGAFPTAVAFTTWAYVLSKAPAGPVGATTYLVPAVSVVISAILLTETPPGITYAGGSLCLLGVALTRWRPRLRPLDPRDGRSHR